jgi:hypothetical protein
MEPPPVNVGVVAAMSFTTDTPNCWNADVAPDAR